MSQSDEKLERVQSLIDRAERLGEEKPERIHSAGGASTITVNAGGIGVWIACTCCAVMLACNLFLIALYVDQQQQIRDMGDYLAAIYAQAPHLKPEKKQ